MPDDETQTGRKNTKERDATRSDSPARAEPGLEDATPSESIAEQRVPGHSRTSWGARPRAADLVRLFAKVTDSPSLLQGAIEDLREIVGERVVREFQAFEERVSRRLTELEKRFDSLETGLTDRMDRHVENVNSQFATVRAEFNGQSSELRTEFSGRLSELRTEFRNQSSESRAEFNDRLDALKSDFNDSLKVLSANFNDKLESQSEKLTAEFNAGFRVLEAQIESLRREFRIVIALFSILTAIGLYGSFFKRPEPQERPEPQIIVVPSAQLAQPDANRELEGAVENVRSQSKETERSDPNVVPDAEDPPSPTGPE